MSAVSGRLTGGKPVRHHFDQNAGDALEDQEPVDMYVIGSGEAMHTEAVMGS